MKTTTKATDFEFTPAIENYLESKLLAIEKFVDSADESVHADVEIGKTTRHHRSGEVFKAEITMHIAGKVLRAEAAELDVYAAIDVAKDEIINQLTSYSKKKTTLFKRGGRTLKDLMRGFSLKR